MYLPDGTAEIRPEEIDRLIAASPLAMIVAETPRGLVANHIPLYRAGSEALRGHIALANDMHRDIDEGAAVLAVFRAEGAYISPNWYPSKIVHHKQVPTWNYQAVHVSGHIRFRHDDKFKRAVAGQITKLQETATAAERPWRMADAPADFIETMLKQIVGIEIAITGMIAKSKLSQNKQRQDFDAVVAELDARGQEGVADAMRRLPRQD